MNNLHLFAGIGGGILADKILGHTVVGAVEIEPFCRKVLAQRQKEGYLEKFPIFDDVRAFNGNEIRERIDCVCGGFPCQDISTAGKGQGLNGNKSRLFYELIRVCGNIKPKFIFLENSPAITGRGLGTVLYEIAKIGFDAEWSTLSAGACGAPHLRERWWCLCKRQNCGGGRLKEKSPRSKRDGLDRIAQNIARGTYATPTVHDSHERTITESVLKRESQDIAVQIQIEERLPTPVCHDSKKQYQSDLLRKSPSLAAIVEVLAPAGGRLNPTWVEWLMNMPLGWTKLKV